MLDNKLQNRTPAEIAAILSTTTSTQQKKINDARVDNEQSENAYNLPVFNEVFSLVIKNFLQKFSIFYLNFSKELGKDGSFFFVPGLLFFS